MSLTAYRRLPLPLRTMGHIDSLRNLLPASKSPMRIDNGGANQAYLFQIERQLALALAHLIDGQTVALASGNYVAESTVSSDDLDETKKGTLVIARRGQGKFRALLLSREPRCRVTGVDRPDHLIASHIKPWQSGTNPERLDF